MFERVEIGGVLFVRSAGVEDAGDRVSRKRRGSPGHEPRRPLANLGLSRPGKRRDGVPEDERFGKGNFERAQAATKAAIAAEDIAGPGVARRFLPLGIGRSDTLS